MVTGFLSPVHIAFLLVVLLLLFGAKRLPEVGSSLGTGLRGFKDSLEGKDAQAQKNVEADAPAAPAALRLNTVTDTDAAASAAAPAAQVTKS